MSGRFLNARDMWAAKHALEIHNARIKRGEINAAEIVRESHVVCGCGAEGCIFIATLKHKAEDG